LSRRRNGDRQRGARNPWKQAEERLGGIAGDPLHWIFGVDLGQQSDGSVLLLCHQSLPLGGGHNRDAPAANMVVRLTEKGVRRTDKCVQSPGREQRRRELRCS